MISAAPGPASAVEIAPNELRSGIPAKVLVTFIINEKEFYIAFEESVNELSTSLGNEDVSLLSPLLEIEEGVLALAPYNEELCRVQVLRCTIFNGVLLRYIDFGNENFVEIDKLKVLPEKYRNIPPLATKMQLEGGKNLSKNLKENELIIVTPIKMENSTTWLTSVEDKWIECVSDNEKEEETIESFPVLINKELYDACQFVKTVKDDYFYDPDFIPDDSCIKKSIFIREEDRPSESVMKVILQRTKYPTLATSNERVFGPPLDWKNPIPGEECKIICSSIPPEVYEDELILLFGRIGMIYCLRLTKKLGIASITFANKEAVARVMAKQNDVKLNEKKINVYSKDNWIPSLSNNMHTCNISNDKEICSCILEMINAIEKKLINQDISSAINKSLIRYIRHSLAIESVEINSSSIEASVNATNFACSIEGELNRQHLEEMHKLLEVGEEKCFRDEGMEEVIVMGLYEQISKLPAASEIKTLIEKFVRDFNKKEFPNEVIRASFLSAEYVLIHPHSDGNGRMSRLILNMILRKAGFPFITFLRQDRIKYFEAITLIRQRNDFTLYYSFVCQCISRDLNQMV